MRSPRQWCEAERDRAWNYYAHAGNLLQARINFFLVAESFLILSFVTTLLDIKSGRVPVANTVRLGVGLLGIVYTSVWLYVNARLDMRVKPLHKVLMEADQSIYDTPYIKVVGGLSTTPFLVYLLPASLLLFWSFLLPFGIEGCSGTHYWCTSWSVILTTLSVTRAGATCRTSTSAA